jgi:hypothetical protein
VRSLREADRASPLRTACTVGADNCPIAQGSPVQRMVASQPVQSSVNETLSGFNARTRKIAHTHRTILSSQTIARTPVRHPYSSRKLNKAAILRNSIPGIPTFIPTVI